MTSLLLIYWLDRFFSISGRLIILLKLPSTDNDMQSSEQKVDGLHLWRRFVARCIDCVFAAILFPVIYEIPLDIVGLGF